MKLPPSRRAKLLRCGLLLAVGCLIGFLVPREGNSVWAAAPDHSAAAHEQAPLPKAYDKGRYPIRVVATTGMVADLVRHIGGPHVEVTPLMGEGIDPHVYKATPGDVRLLIRADIVFYSGLHLEGKMAEIFEKLAPRKPTFAVTARLPEEKLLSSAQGAHDPHVWFDLDLWGQCGAYVLDILKAFDPAHADEYQQRGQQYLEQIAATSRYAREQIASVPKTQRLMITAHDAFQYFGRAYDLEVLAIQGINTEGESGVHKVNQLVETIASRRVKAVFIETSVSDKNIRALLEGCSARGHTLTIGGELYSDAMGTEGTPEGEYLGMVRHNVDTITGALK